MTNILEYRGETIVLNNTLIMKQKITQDKLLRLFELHKERIDLFLDAKEFDSSNIEGMKSVKTYAKELEAIEFEMQEVWGFDRNINKHCWWFQIPHCICEKSLNNTAAFKGENRFVNPKCPIHG